MYQQTDHSSIIHLLSVESSLQEIFSSLNRKRNFTIEFRCANEKISKQNKTKMQKSVALISLRLCKSTNQRAKHTTTKKKEKNRIITRLAG